MRLEFWGAVRRASRTGLYLLANGEIMAFEPQVGQRWLCSYRKSHLAACARPSWTEMIGLSQGRAMGANRRGGETPQKPNPQDAALQSAGCGECSFSPEPPPKNQVQ